MLIEKSRVADAKMRSFNKDGREGMMAGNNLRCIGKYLYDRGYVRSERVRVETGSGVMQLRLFLRDGRVSSVEVGMGRVSLKAADVPVRTDKPRLVNSPVRIGENDYRVTCLSVGNPHCVVFCEAIDEIDLERIDSVIQNFLLPVL